MLFDTIEILLLSVLAFCLIAQLLFYWVVLAKPYYYLLSVAKNKIRLPSYQPPVSVIICIKNNYYDLAVLLPPILEQDYPEFEVIVVTDGLSDENEETLMQLKRQYENLYATHIPEDTRNVSRKKLGLTLGIKAAKYETFLFMEADGKIRSEKWISLMSRHFRSKTIVLGFSAMEKRKGIASKFRAYDYFFSNLQMISLALFRHPYAGNGRNLGYAKKHFTEQRGFVKHRILQQGEDDLFVNEIANRKNTAVEFSAKSVVIAGINEHYDWKKWKTDRAITSDFYKPGPHALWRFEMLIRCCFGISFIACILLGYPYLQTSDFWAPGIALFCFLGRFFSQLYVINRTASGLHLEKFYLTIPFFDLFQVFVNIYFYIYGLFKRKENYTYKYEKR
ncbi:MAG: glycosyltransferase [Dysgonamonadaceae bacterium]|jgi:glycosyltransferase involved in cell wall biosynthesis|nr:glycosyltransferase [Dysgonamonadaceae bacterium]